MNSALRPARQLPRWLPRERLRPFAVGRLRRRTLIGGGALVTGLLLVALGALVFGGGQAAPSHAVPTALVPIVRTDVVERQQVPGTLDYQGSFAVTNGSTAGMVTRLPTAGSIVRRGQPLYELDRRPVALLYGYRPAYRDFTLGMSAGVDVRVLQQNLLALGFSAQRTLALTGRFDLATFVAVEQWQRGLGLAPTGTVPFGSVVFLPGPVRISATGATVGSAVAAGGPILTATATEPAVLIALDPGSVAQLRVGDRVLVTMPNQATTPGRVATVGRVATSSGQGQNGGPATPTVPVTVSLRNAAASGGLDQAPVQVAITTQAARDVLAVPISALLAQPGGGYAVSIRAGRTTRLVPVTTGLFDDVAGRVEIDGPGLAPGLAVEVPSG